MIVNRFISSLITSLRKYNHVLIHVLAWVVYISLGTLKGVFLIPGYKLHILDVIVTHVPPVMIFYGHYYVLMQFAQRRKYRWFLPLAEVLLFCCMMNVYYLTGYVLAGIINPEASVPAFRLVNLLVGTFWAYAVYASYALGYYFAIQSVRRARQLKNIELQKLKIEQEHLQAEHAFLRAQINPHFLHNTLNFFYAKSLACGAELSEGILTLSEIMRYSLEAGDDTGTVSLVREVEHLKNVIRINQLRFSHKLHLDFEIKGDTSGIKIIPLVLITLVENAFKHGELTDARYPVKLVLEVNEARTSLNFSTYNKKKKGPKELSHGIGVENIRKRLNWTYNGKYQFETGSSGENDDFYFANLYIFFNDSKNGVTAQTLEPDINHKLKMI
ncbi:sensor histidine kinase [Chitinophaga sp. sic0106]|uniref:sensor histidine kinase n=1 Tax=Chitinophaga sp. sic0106 TaxID=2854785 RepID=UPI001C457A3C|nr:sensor histidine kinase [Chitinophaga sp. sic0106]MBV7529435.1 sensor histidine kinase [Chitinophaga sp. sic0106]